MKKSENRKLPDLPEEYKTWERHLQRNEACADLTASDKSAAKEALLYLRNCLGEDFIVRGLADRHLLLLTFENLAPWTRKWLAWLASALNSLIQCRNFSSLLSRIKNAQKYAEAVSVLENAHKFYVAGFKIAFEPSVSISGNVKNPDLMIIDSVTRQEIYVEVSDIGKSKPEAKAHETMWNIFQSLFGTVPFLQFSGRICKTLAPKHLEAILTKVKSAIEQVSEGQIFQAVEEKGIIDLGISTIDGKDLLEKWASTRELRIGDLDGPPYDTNEVIRTKNRIEYEQRQLPPERPGLIILSNTNLFINMRDLAKAISDLEEKVYEIPKLIAVIVKGKWTGGGEENDVVHIGRHMLIKNTEFELFSERYLILDNRFCENTVSETIKSKIYKSFTGNR